MTTPTEDRLFAALDVTWPAARVLPEGPWLLRDGRGGGQRVSAATVRGEASDADIPTAEEGMRALGQRPLFMIRRADRDLDMHLERRGYAIVDPVTIYVAPVKDIAADLPEATVTPSWPPFAVQCEIWAAAGIGQERIAVMWRAAEPKSAILGRAGDNPAGIAFVAAHGDVAMVHALEVAPSARRRGLGRILMQGAASWARERGAAWIALAVTDANVAANALYQRLGMTPAAHYHYRRAAEAEA